MDGKVLSIANRDWVIKKLDEVIRLPFWAEPFDGIGIGFLIDFIDLKGDKIIPDSFDDEINQIIILCADGQYESASRILAATIAELTQLRQIPSEVWNNAIINTTVAITSLIQAWVENKKQGG